MRVTVTDDQLADALEASSGIDVLRAQLRGEQDTNLLLLEALVDAELALEDRGWQKITTDAGSGLTRDGLRQASDIARAMATTNALVRRGLALRCAYIWGSGVQIAAEDGDVNDVVQAFLDDEGNWAAFTGEQAHEENERALGTDGNVFAALFTRPLTGSVQVRTIPFAEIQDVIANPDDRDEPWFYLRRWHVVEIDARTATSARRAREEFYPALGYRPATRVRVLDGKPVNWDTPVLHISVNRLDGWKFGIGDVYTALPWARAYREFLADWAQLVKALSRFAWRQTSKGRSGAERAAARLRERIPQHVGETGSAAGATATMSADVTLEAIPKSGATIDSESGRPLAAMVAAALDVPVTMLLGDPGTTGARATAETLDTPMVLAMQMRRTRWSEAYRRILGHVIAESVRAPRGALRGTITRNEHGREVVTFAGDVEPTVQVTWPELDPADPAQVITAIVAADGTGKVPPLTIARLLLQALGVDDVDEVLDELVDADGNWVDPDVAAAARSALDVVRRGDQPRD